MGVVSVGSNRHLPIIPTLTSSDDSERGGSPGRDDSNPDAIRAPNYDDYNSYKKHNSNNRYYVGQSKASQNHFA